MAQVRAKATTPHCACRSRKALSSSRTRLNTSKAVGLEGGRRNPPPAGKVFQSWLFALSWDECHRWILFEESAIVILPTEKERGRKGEASGSNQWNRGRNPLGPSSEMDHGGRAPLPTRSCYPERTPAEKVEERGRRHFLQMHARCEQQRQRLRGHHWSRRRNHYFPSHWRGRGFHR